MIYLIIDDNADDLLIMSKRLQRVLTVRGLSRDQIITLASVSETVWWLFNWSWEWRRTTLATAISTPQLGVMVDLRMPDPYFPDISGITIAATITNAMYDQRLPPVPIIAWTAESSPQADWEALQAGCLAVWEKPVPEEKIQEFVHYRSGSFVQTPLHQRGMAQQTILRQQRLFVEHMLQRQLLSLRQIYTAQMIEHIFAQLSSYIQPRSNDEDGKKLVTQLGGAGVAEQLIMMHLAKLSTEEILLGTHLLNNHPQSQLMTQYQWSRRYIDDVRTALFEHLAQRLNSFQLH